MPTSKWFLLLSVVFFLTVFSLSFGSFVSTESGAHWLIQADTGWRAGAPFLLALGIQLLVFMGSLALSFSLPLVVEGATRRQGYLLVGLALFCSGLGIVLSAGGAYVNYHQNINESHLQVRADLALEEMQRRYRKSREAFPRLARQLDASLQQALLEIGFWDSEMRLQDSRESPNREGKGPRWTYAYTRAESLRDYVFLHTGVRPGDNPTSSATGTARQPTMELLLSAAGRFPEELDLSSISSIESPLRRVTAASAIFESANSRLRQVFLQLPDLEALPLPPLPGEMAGHSPGDRVTLELDGQSVSNIPVPPDPRTGPSTETASPAERVASYILLRDAIHDFYAAMGVSDAEGLSKAGEDALVMGEHPWLAAMERAGSPRAIEWAAMLPAILVDLGVLAAGLLHGLLALALRPRPPGSEPLATIAPPTMAVSQE